MATINFATREITTKIVYFGATGAGSNTNVQRLYELVDGHDKSNLHKFGPLGVDERSWYFDYVPGGPHTINGFRLCYRIYSLPGRLELRAHREEVISSTDALVFVSDARPERNASNLDSMLGLEELLATTGIELANLPVVLQVNHVDHPKARLDDAVAYDLNPYGWTVVSACARDGRGVLATHEEVSEIVTRRIHDNLAGKEAAITIVAVHQPERESDVDVIRAHIDAISAKSASTPPELVAEHSGSVQGGTEAYVIELPFQPRELLGCSPTEVLSTQVEVDRVVVELRMTPMRGTEDKRLTVILENRPTDTPPVPRHQPSEARTEPPVEGRVFDYLPATVDLEAPDPAADLPPLWYGVMGVSGGVVIGLLLGYLVGVVL